ncbi:MAG: heat-inducible transcriptional repressor HrcA [Thermodesulfobacteriota bacterium]
MSLNSREIDVINIIVQAYIQHAAPVGSRYVAKQSGLDLSPASMRNIMADLTDKGYLTQPYTSAGRIPTQKAFRFYVDSMLKPGPLSSEQQKSIREYLTQSGLQFSDILEQTSKLISSQASQVGMAVAPQKDLVRWQQIDFVLIRPGLVLAVLVFQGGIIQNKLLHVEEKLTADDLVKYSNYLNESFQGRTIIEVKKKILEQMQEAKSRFNELYSKALGLAKETFSQESEPEIFLQGTLHVLERLDSKDLSSMRELLEFLEQRSELLGLLEKISQSSQGLSIVFGTEFYGPELGEWGLISSPYQVRGQTLGMVGTIGPIHMDYSRLVPMVDYIAKMLSEILETRF